MSDLKDIKTQKEYLMTGLSSVPIDGKEYEQMLKQYKTLVETEETIKKGRRERGVLKTLLEIGGFCVTAAGVLLVPNMLAELAYEKEKDLSMKNQTVWNLIGKKFDNFKQS